MLKPSSILNDLHKTVATSVLLIVTLFFVACNQENKTSSFRPGFNRLPPMHSSRSNHTTLLLKTGQVFITNDIYTHICNSGLPMNYKCNKTREDINLTDEIYNPSSKTFLLFKQLNKSEKIKISKLLKKSIISSEFDYKNLVLNYHQGSFHLATKIPSGDILENCRRTRLKDGNILLTGCSVFLKRKNTLNYKSPILYNSQNDEYVPLKEMNTPRVGHTTTLLSDGNVIIVGGSSVKNLAYLKSTEVFNYSRKSFEQGPSLHETRAFHTTTLLKNGDLLLTGGINPKIWYLGISSTEKMDSKRRVFTEHHQLTTPSFNHNAVLLNSGDILITGGIHDEKYEGYNLQRAELYIPLPL